MDKQSVQFAMNKVRARFDKSVPQAQLVYGRRLAAAKGFSLAEIDDAGLSLDEATAKGLSVDVDRMSSLGVNVELLKKYLLR
jgi:ribosomal protein L13E